MKSITVKFKQDLLENLRHPTELLVMIEKDEGNSGKLYKDTEDLWTIGIGFCLDRRPMPREVAIYWLDLILDEILADLSNTNQYNTFHKLNQARQFAIINMCYQLGVMGVCHPVHGFIKMWGSLAVEDYEAAAKHAIDSVWYRQTTNRATRVAEVIRTGTLEQYGM